MNTSLLAVRIARHLPFASKFSEHLDRCAALEVLYRPFDPNLPRLRLSHVFGLARLPDMRICLANPHNQRIDFSVDGDDVADDRLTPSVDNAISRKDGRHTLH